MVRRWEERNVRTALGNGAEAEVAKAQRRFACQPTDNRAGRPGRPTEQPAIASRLDRTVDVFRGNQRVTQRFGVAAALLSTQLAPADRPDRHERDTLGEGRRVDPTGKVNHPARILCRAQLGERRRGDARRLDLVAGRLEARLRLGGEASGSLNAGRVERPGGVDTDADRPNLHRAPQIVELSPVQACPVVLFPKGTASPTGRGPFSPGYGASVPVVCPVGSRTRLVIASRRHEPATARTLGPDRGGRPGRGPSEVSTRRGRRT